jgi:hypothetical protein
MKLSEKRKLNDPLLFMVGPRWRDRIVPFFTGDWLEVYHLSRADLIFTKFLAELDRHEDLPDIVNLQPTRKELVEVERHLIELDSDEEWRQQVKNLIREMSDE